MKTNSLQKIIKKIIKNGPIRRFTNATFKF